MGEHVRRTVSVSTPSLARPVDFGPEYGERDTPVVSRADCGDGTDGPLIVEEFDTPVVVSSDWRAHLDDSANLVLEAIETVPRLGSG